MPRSTLADALEQLAAQRLAAPAVLGLALLARALVATQPHSGQSTPPKFGDYEAQRHWMEITVHTPALEWYVNTTDNDLLWWGLDYPPLSAYQSWAYGQVMHRLDPPMVALRTSRGYESARSKALMRLSVVVSDLLFLFPAALLYVQHAHRGARAGDRAWALAALLLQPGLVLIDHGHFQYNNISLGLALAAVAAIQRGRALLGSALYVAAFNHKQMALFYAPAFFAHLLGRCLQGARPAWRAAGGVARLGAVVLGTMVLCWAPFLRTTDAAAAVAARLAPVQRGIFEDHVGNFWCTSSLLIKWKRLLAQPALVKLAAATTLAAASPSMAHQILRPSDEGFLYALLNSAMAFFLFGFQVHEKSILLPLVPAALLALREPTLLRVFGVLATFSMWPLLKRDGLGAAYVGCILLYFCLGAPAAAGGGGRTRAAAARTGGSESRARAVARVWEYGVYAAAVALHAAYALPAPPRLPYMHAAAVTAFSALNFAAIAVYANVQQWRLPAEAPAATRGRKQR